MMMYLCLFSLSALAMKTLPNYNSTWGLDTFSGTHPWNVLNVNMKPLPLRPWFSTCKVFFIFTKKVSSRYFTFPFHFQERMSSYGITFLLHMPRYFSQQEGVEGALLARTCNWLQVIYISYRISIRFSYNFQFQMWSV